MSGQKTLMKKLIIGIAVVVLLAVACSADAKRRDVKAIGQAALRKGIISAPPAGYDFTKIRPGASYKPGRLLVRFEPREIKGKLSAMSAKEKKGILNSLGNAVEKRSFDIVPGLSLVELPPGMTVEEALKKFNKASGILYAEPDYEVEICQIPNDGYFNNLWGMHNTGQSGGTPDADIDAPEAWDLATGSGDVIVAVIDTGVDYTHPDLAANMWTNDAEINGAPGVDDDGNGYVDDIYGYDFRNNDGNPMDDNGHGTHCAGTIGAKGDNNQGVAGVCWNIKIMAMKFLNSSGSGYTSDAIECLNYSVSMGAKISSNSWGGGGDSQNFKNAIITAGEAGMLFVAAAGNDSRNNDVYPHYPSSYDCNNIISVMATNRYDNKSGFSNYGQVSVDLGAPGSDIFSCKLGGGYAYKSGTSMATPHVAGACALLWQYNPTLSREEIKDLLIDSVDVVFNPNNNFCVSNGRLNIYKALSLVHPSRGRIDMDSDFYACSDAVDIRLADYDLMGNGAQEVNFTTSSGDAETITLYEQSPPVGIFTGTISTEAGYPEQGDGVLQISDGDVITVIYEDADDGTGNPATADDTAVIDCSGPVISNVDFADEFTGYMLYLNFDTNEPAAVRIECGTSCGSSDIVVEDSNLLLEHSVKIKVPQIGEYFFTIEATDISGNTTIDSNDGNCYKFTAKSGTIIVPDYYQTIQEAMDAVPPYGHANIVVSPGTYHETLDFESKNIVLSSIDPCDWDVVKSTVIDGDGAAQTILLNYYYATCINGFTITGGSKGLLCGGISSGTVKNCIIEGNSSAGLVVYRQGAVYVDNCIIRNNPNSGLSGGTPATPIRIKNSLISNNGTGIFINQNIPSCRIDNCTIVNNHYGVRKTASGSVYIKNCILWNKGDDLYGCSATYSCIKDGDDCGQNGNICADPCFIAGDEFYNLQFSSPCIDAGADGDYQGQTDIDGDPRVIAGRIDIGADEVQRIYNTDLDLWYLTINDAIEDADNYDTIIVYPGTYEEGIEFGAKNITLVSADPNDWEVVGATVIDGNGASDTVLFDFGDNGTLRGFTITGGTRGINAVYAHPVGVRNCIITNNSNLGARFYSCEEITVENCMVKDNANEGVFLEAINGNIKNNLIYNNGTGIFSNGGVFADIHNCTIAHNDIYGIGHNEISESNMDIKNCIIWENGVEDLYNYDVTYSCISDINDIGDPNITYNINNDPCFVSGDEFYHLQYGSPCIDTGDPNGDHDGQFDIDSGLRVAASRIDMGSDEIKRIYNETKGLWYPTINKAAEDANECDTIVLYPGTYYESLDLSEYPLYYGGKNLEIRGSDPCNWDIVNATVVDGDGAENTFALGFGAPDVCIKGLTITGGGQGAHCTGGGFPLLSNCILRNNSDNGVKVGGCHAIITNCIIKDNYNGGISAGSASLDVENSLICNNNSGVIANQYCDPTISNCTIVENDSYGIIQTSPYAGLDIFNCIVWNNSDNNDLVDCSAAYSWLTVDGDPCFVQDDEFYHLQANSPCINGGDPNGDYNGQVDIDGDMRVIVGRVDIGSDEIQPKINNVNNGKWYLTINAAAEEADEYDTIVLYPGTYYESLDMSDYPVPPYGSPKHITIQGADPNDWDVVEATVIDGCGAASTISMDYGISSALAGLTITGGIRGINGSVATTRNCIITGNSDNGITIGSCNGIIANCIIKDNGGSGVFLNAGNHNITNNLIYGNNAGVTLHQYTTPTISNCTITGNAICGIERITPYCGFHISNCILWDNNDELYDCSTTYSCIKDCDDAAGTGNICSDANDPLFVDADSNDFHLLPDSPCINTGNPNGDYDGQFDIDGNERVILDNVDIGADELQPKVYNVTADKLYLTIDAAIGDAYEDDTIVVYPGVYEEDIEFGNKNITLISTDPNDWEVVEATVIDGGGATNTVLFDWGHSGSLSGFTLTGGGHYGVHAVYADSATIGNCIITNNNIGARLFACGATMKNCIVKDNVGEGILLEAISNSDVRNNLVYNNGQGIVSDGGVFIYVNNCTIVYNDLYGVKGYRPEDTGINARNCVIWGNGDDLQYSNATYSCISDIEDIGDPNITHNINYDPLFADFGYYHLQYNSPCIDAGDSTGDYDGQTDIDGEARVIDVGGKGDGIKDVDVGADEYNPGF